MGKHNNTDVVDDPRDVEEIETNGAQKFVIVVTAVYTAAVCIVNAAYMLGADGDFWQACYDFQNRYWFWIIAAIGVLAVATWAAGKFHRRDVREDRLIEDIERRERAAVRRDKVRKAIHRGAPANTGGAATATALPGSGRKAIEGS